MKFITSLFAQIQKDYFLTRSNLMAHVANIILWCVIFPLMINAIISTAEEFGITYGFNLIKASILGFLIWRFSTNVMTEAVNSIYDETLQGVVQQLILSSSLSITRLSLIKVISSSIFAFLEMLIYSGALYLIFRVYISITGPLLIIFGILILQIWSFSIFLIGLSFKINNLPSIVSMISTLTLFFSGAMVPLNELGNIFLFIKYLWPLALPIDLMRQLAIQNQTIPELIASGEMYGLVIQTTVFILLAVIVLPRQYQRVLANGILSTQ